MTPSKRKVSNVERERLQKIFRKTDGYCHICHHKLIFSNYGILGANGSWQIEHSIARANGGSNHLNNLYASCISCNIEKGTMHSKTVRFRYGKTRAPFSRSKKELIKTDNMTGGTLVGGTIGLAIGGPVGGLFGGLVGGLIGNSTSPKK
jgi:5-methylcytosine-specific restriction endonuclease McrA